MQYRTVLEATLGVAFVGWLIGYTLSNRRMDQAVNGAEQLHKKALGNIHAVVPPCGLPVPPETLPSDVQVEEMGGFKFACFVDQTTDGVYVHHIMGMHPGNQAGRLSAAMLQIMRRLVQHFTICGFEYEVMLHVDVQPSGSQHIDFKLTPEREAAFRKAMGVAP